MAGGTGRAQNAVVVARRLGAPEREAVALVHLERLTFSYGLDEREMTAQQRDVMTRLPPGEVALRAQVQAALAMRLVISPRQYENEQADLARSALQQLPSVTDPLARADIILGIRGGLLDNVPPEDSCTTTTRYWSLALRLVLPFTSPRLLTRASLTYPRWPACRAAIGDSRQPRLRRAERRGSRDVPAGSGRRDAGPSAWRVGGGARSYG